MRFPPFADLDSDQRKIYSESPTHGAILIVGPPGSGKTVVAMHRAFRLSGDKRQVSVIMFNKVLSRYTSNFPDLPDNITITHMHDWIKKWYMSAFGHKHPAIDKYGTPDWDRIRQQIATCSPSVKEKLHWGHLIIDEGQDFPPSMYACLYQVLKIFKNEKESMPTLTVFADENQTIH